MSNPNVRIMPAQGVIPFQAAIVIADVADTYLFHLPDGSQVTTSQPRLDVTVDQLEYSVKVDCMRGDEVRSQTVTAVATNQTPNIRAVMINGDRSRWQLKPFERTLIQPIIEYPNEWSLQSVRVTGSTYRGPYSTFYPPYKAGECHALWGGSVWENAAVVYPLYMSIDSPSGLPYARSGLDVGYPTSYKYTNQYQWGGPSDLGDAEGIPAQDGHITVTVKDNFGRTASRTFEIPIAASGFVDATKK